MRPDALPDVAGLVAVDTETTGLHPDPPENARISVVSVAWRSGERIERQAFPFAFGRGKGGQATLELEADPNLGQEMWWVLLRWLADRRLVMHNGNFDLTMFWAGTPEAEGMDLSAALVWDTSIASRDLDATYSAELADLEQRMGILDTRARAEWLQAKKQRSKVNAMEWKRAADYAAVDAYVTLIAAERQLDRYDMGEGDRTHLDEDMELLRALFQLERRGVGYDIALSRSVAADLQRWEAQIASKLPFRATLPQAKRYFFGEIDPSTKKLRATPESYTDGGSARLDEQELARLVSMGVEYAAEFSLLQRIKHARTAWYEPYANSAGWDGRLRTVYSQAKVISGRLSSTRINLQAIPHEYQIPEIVERFPSPRQLFRPRDGARLWELDLSQAELRVAAVEAECEPMLRLIREGADIHGAVARQLFGDEPGSDTWPENRQIGKRADFAFIFGVGAETFQKDLAKLTGIWRTMHECNQIVNRWRGLYPEYGKTIKRYMEAANHWGYVKLVNGRVRHFATWEERHKAFNQYVQGSLAELMKQWLVATEDTFPGPCLLTIHDSLVLETADEALVHEVQALGEKLGTTMFDVPMVVDVKEWGHAE